LSLGLNQQSGQVYSRVKRYRFPQAFLLIAVFN